MVYLHKISQLFKEEVQKQPEELFLDVIRSEVLRLLSHAIHSHLHQRIFFPLWFFFYLRFLQQQLKLSGGLALFTLSLRLPLNLALFFTIYSSFKY
jgi:hypothetical protein